MGLSGVMGGEGGQRELTDDELAAHDAKTKITQDAAAEQEVTRDRAHWMADAGNTDMGIAVRSEKHGLGELAEIQRSTAAVKEEAAGEKFDEATQIVKETVPAIIAQITAMDSTGSSIGINSTNENARAMIIDQLDKVLGVEEEPLVSNAIDSRYATAIPGVCKVVSTDGTEVKFEKYQ